MIDHMTFRVADAERSKAFYAAALAPLGYRPLYDEVHEGSRVIGFGHDVKGQAKIDTWLVDNKKPVTTGCHLAWLAPDRAAVDAFHAAALAAGGADNGAPGLRPHYHPGYYGAFVIDPDGNNVEAVCHRA
jgi:catechol 2,3-dioxygenase-like lactoylglutathione lyase family enzyme